jgi:hypothetical protein
MGEDDSRYYRDILNRKDDPFYEAKFDEHGDVRPGWSYTDWTLDRVAGIPRFGSKNCHTVLRHLPEDIQK